VGPGPGSRKLRTGGYDQRRIQGSVSAFAGRDYYTATPLLAVRTQKSPGRRRPGPVLISCRLSVCVRRE
jgi:hypothetical protein